MSTTELPLLRLQKNRQRRMLAGHEWVFSNEIEPASLAACRLKAGQLVHLGDYRGKFLASAWFNPQTLIAARVVDRRPLAAFGAGELQVRLAFALALREQIYPTPHYRWVHGESDRLPGLVIDRFGPVLSVQITTAGMELLRDVLVETLEKFPGIESMVFQNDLEFRKLEGLSTGPATFCGPEPGTLDVREHGLEWQVPSSGGQKTGWFFDQRDNRARLQRYVSGKTVADLYCYAGAWGLHAARYGAASVTCVDSSATAVELTRKNAVLNGLDVETAEADSMGMLRQWADAGRQFDLLVIDPPALIKRRKDADAGLQAYYQLNRLAAKAVRPGGILVSCSCSHHLPENELVGIVNHAAWSDNGRSAAILEFGSQSADHPVHPAMPETRYLKALFVRIS